MGSLLKSILRRGRRLEKNKGHYFVDEDDKECGGDERLSLRVFMAGMTITRNRKRTESNLKVQRRACETGAAVLAGKKPLNHRWRWYHEESRHLIICDRAIRLIAIHFL